MKIQINDHRKIFAIQEEFNKFYPNLKIEFLGKPSKVGNPPSEKQVKGVKTLGDCRVVHNKGELTLSAAITISDLKQTLADSYGLSAVFFRRLGDKWIETTDNTSSIPA
jgi:hypothetical protein